MDVKIKNVLGWVTVLLGIVICLPTILAAETPMTIEFNLLNGEGPYGCEDPVEAEIVIKNPTQKDLWISESLFNRDFFLNLSIIDPAGLSLVGKPAGPNRERVHVPPPVFLKSRDGRLVRCVRCRKLAKNGSLPENEVMRKGDLSDYYSFELGSDWYRFKRDRHEHAQPYTAQVQVSAMVFDGPIDAAGKYCSIENPRWTGLLESATQRFRIDGRFPIRILPDIWDLNNPPKKIKVQIPIPRGMQFKAKVWLKKSGIESRGEKVRVAPDPKPRYLAPGIPFTHILLAEFKAEDCLMELGRTEAGLSSRMVVEWRNSQEQAVCGSQRVTIKKE